MLESVGYVVLSQDKELEEDTYFPAYPAESIKFGQILKDLRSPATEWLEHWSIEAPMNIKPMIAELIDPNHELANTKFDTVLASLKSA